MSIDACGFTTSAEMCSTSCGGSFNLTSGVLRSPWHPNQYPSATDCIYLISPPSGTNIQITINSADISCYQFGVAEEDLDLGSGLTDYIEMRDGGTADSTIMLRYCGNGTYIPSTMQSTQNVLWMR